MISFTFSFVYGALKHMFIELVRTENPSFNGIVFSPFVLRSYST